MSTGDHIERICVALDASPFAHAALDAAAELALQLKAELSGLFVEDVNLLRTAAYSFTREMGLSSGVSRPLRLDEVERALRTRAEGARAALAERSAALQLRWSFQTIRGAGVAPLLTLATEASVAVIGPQPALQAAHLRSAGRRHTLPDAGPHPIAALYDGSDRSLVSIRIAALLARSRAVPVELILCGGARTVPEEMSDPFREQWAGDVDVRCLPIAESSAANIASAVRGAHAALLIAGGPPAGVSERDAMDLLLRLDCPLALLMSPSTNREHPT
jgi:hypothetical protein